MVHHVFTRTMAVLDYFLYLHSPYYKVQGLQVTEVASFCSIHVPSIAVGA